MNKNWKKKSDNFNVRKQIKNKTIVLGNKNKSRLAFGRAIILERALATQLQLDVAYATHVTRLNAVDAANVGFDGGRVGMRLATRGLGMFSFMAHQVGEIVLNPIATLGWFGPMAASVMDNARWFMAWTASVSSWPCNM
jgi:hypothetical protein